MQLTEHFSLDEMTRSRDALRKGIDNTPSAHAIAQLIRWCTQIGEPVRTLLGVPLHMDSGYRCLTLNSLEGGDPHSAHMEGRAGDVIPIGMDLQAAFDRIRASDIPVDKIIVECGAWLHMAIAKEGEQPRRLAMTGAGEAGHWTYTYVT